MESIEKLAGLDSSKTVHVLDFCHVAHHISLALEALGLTGNARRKTYGHVRKLLKKSRYDEVVVELGIKDVDFTAALGAPEAVTLQVLDTDPGQVAEARQRLEAKGVYGPISVARFDGKSMPYVDNLVNMVVAHGSDIPQEEIFRVLVPGDALCTEDLLHTLYDCFVRKNFNHLHFPVKNPFESMTLDGRSRIW
ncbi:MAG: hypothetical protein ACQESR_04850 [Planctomycetota bacterium]